MKAAVVTSHGKVAIQEIPMPESGPAEALVRIEACGLCGTTDRHIVEGSQAHHPADWYPAILGHEAVGIVLKTGPEVQKFQVGDRVTRPVAIWPGTQLDGLYSAWGGFAEYGIVRDLHGAPDYTADRQHVVPADISLEDAVLAVSVSEVASWMEKLGDLRDKTIAIGGTGFAAAVMCQCARAKGASRIIAMGRSPQKLAWMENNGATHVIKLDAHLRAMINELTGGRGVDWFLDAAGHQEVFEMGLACLRIGGNAAIYGAPEGFGYRVPLGAVGGDFSVHYLTPTDDSFYQETCRRIVSGELDTAKLRSHIWSGLESLPEAICDQAKGNVLKGLVKII